MEMRKTNMAGRVALAVVCAVSTGCVVNPYIKDGQVSTVDLNHKQCESVNKLVELSRTSAEQSEGGKLSADALQIAYQYAECVRRAMANKAGKYAWMNNAGGATLINMAGLAGYSGIRGGHQAQVAAFSIGGTAAYGTQQYLYSKPREAIYWSGSQAIGCAIGAMRRRSLLKAQAESLPILTTTQTAFQSASQSERSARAGLGSVEGCPNIESKFVEMDGVIKRNQDAFRTRENDISARKQRLNNASASALGDLMATTDAIRDTVNGQLAREQPDPSELQKFLNNPKLTTLAGSVSPKPNDTPAPKLVRFSFNQNINVQKKQQCRANMGALPAYNTAEDAYMKAAADHDRALADNEARLAAIETMADADQKGSQIKHCTLGRTNTLLPFGLTFAQAGQQKVPAGKTLSIPITGGVPPFSVTVVASSDGDIPAVARQTDEGGFEIAIGGTSTKKGAKSTFLVNDDVGAGKPVSVEVVD